MATKGYMRKPGARQPRKRTAIFTEGEVTEVEYLKYLVSRLGIPKELVEFFPSEHTDPKGLVNDAVAAKDLNRSRAKRKKEGLIENWWVLVDTECGRDGLAEAVQKAKSNKIWLGFCDPSIEFWLLLHFRCTTQSFGSVKELIKQLKKELPGYDEGNKHPNMETLFPRLPKALNHASKLRKNHTWQGYGSPRADVDLLVEELNCQANRGGELFERNEPSWNDLSMHHCGFN